MESKITLTRYIPYETLIHKFDSRLKLISLIILISVGFIPAGYSGFIVLSGLILLILFFSKTPLRTLLAPIKLVFVVFLMLVFINLLVYDAHINNPSIEHDKYFLFSLFGWRDIYWQHFIYSSQIALRIYFLMLFTILFTSTTKPTKITEALESLLKPLKVIKFPVEEVALVISIALRFIPTILDETVMIMNAQASRGVDFSNGNIKDKAKSMSTLIIPMFANSFQRSDDLANAIEARGYIIGQQRTKYHPPKITFLDIILTLIVIGTLIVVVLINVGIISNFGDTWYEFFKKS